MRLDQWLWAVRLFKSRSLATEAIRGGRVKINNEATKAAHEARADELVVVSFPTITRIVRVIGAPKSRVGAKLVALYMEDLTPPEEYERQRALNFVPGARPAGAGRPTKRERREIDELEEGA